MTITELLDLLRVQRGPDANGNYVCACPICDRGQKTFHLQVSDGIKGIVLRCAHEISDKNHNRDICRALGIEMKDLFHADSRGADAPKRGRPRISEKGATAKKTAYTYSDLRLDTTYIYTDENGNERFRVERLYQPDGDKTFRQYYIGTDGKRNNSVPDARYGDIIYRLPEVLSAIVREDPVFIVEGEKDVDNLRKIGFCATCNPAGTGRGWKEDYNHWFKGADVVVLADNDPAIDDKRGTRHYKGQIHAKRVADNLVSVAKSVKLCDTLHEYCGQLPVKGDISDLIAIEGADARNIVNRIVRETPVYDPEVLRWWEDERDRVAAQYREHYPYDVVDGMIVKHSITRTGEKSVSPLANFVAVPSAIITKDDGLTKRSEFEIRGWDIHGAKLPTVRVPAKDFDSMAWVREQWDLRASLYPGNMIRQNISFVMSEVGSKCCKRWTEYVHTGWVKLRGKWCFLYHGGAIGADDVTVTLEDKLKMYTFGNLPTGEDAISVYEGISATLGIMDVIPKRISIPLLGTVFLAPLREFLEQAGIKPRYALWLLGGTQTKKTTCSTLALSHFGYEFNGASIPASFRDTANSILKKAFILKDMPILVDDFHPQSSVQEKRKMTDTAQALSRAFGDGASRSRMSADLSLRESMPPRGVAIMSGEDLPEVGESGLARYYIVQFYKTDIDLYDEKKRRALTDLQQSARKGIMQTTMKSFIEWLAAQAETLPARLEEEYMNNRERAMTMMKGQFARAPETIAMIMTAYDHMLYFMQDTGFLSDADVESMQDEAWNVIVNNARKQGNELKEDRPSAMFKAAVQNLLLNEQATVRNVNATGKNDDANTMVGWYDTDNYYFLPDIVYRHVHDLYTREGLEFPLSKKTLWKQLREDGIITDSDKGSSTKTKRIRNQTVRVICIAKPKIDCDGQTEMQFEEISDDDVTKEMT